MACVTNEVPSIRWPLPAVAQMPALNDFCSKHIPSITLSTELVLCFQDPGKISVYCMWLVHREARTRFFLFSSMSLGV